MPNVDSQLHKSYIATGPYPQQYPAMGVKHCNHDKWEWSILVCSEYPSGQRKLSLSGNSTAITTITSMSFTQKHINKLHSDPYLFHLKISQITPRLDICRKKKQNIKMENLRSKTSSSRWLSMYQCKRFWWCTRKIEISC